MQGTKHLPETRPADTDAAPATAEEGGQYTGSPAGAMKVPMACLSPAERWRKQRPGETHYCLPNTPALPADWRTRTQPV